jgi:hypothetical protein
MSLAALRGLVRTRELQRGFGYDHAMLYPDHAGFARFATSIRRLR